MEPDTGAPPPQAAPPPARLDVQDGLLVAGFSLLEAGVAFIYWPAALILAGTLLFAFAYLIERTKLKQNRLKGKHGSAES